MALSISTIVEIINVLQTINKCLSVIPIYNSRNYKCLIDSLRASTPIMDIYNSRNYKCLIDCKSRINAPRYIYNSRNYKCFIDGVAGVAIIVYLQQQKLQMFYRRLKPMQRGKVSTIVEITNVLQTGNIILGTVKSTIVEITNVLQTSHDAIVPTGIYNSRNYKCFIDKKTVIYDKNNLQQQKLQMFYRRYLKNTLQRYNLLLVYTKYFTQNFKEQSQRSILSPLQKTNFHSLLIIKTIIKLCILHRHPHLHKEIRNTKYPYPYGLHYRI